MSIYSELKKLWKKLGINGQVKNFSSKEIWVLETESPVPTAHLLRPMTKSPPTIDCDAFKRIDGFSIEKHKFWWKFYDLSIVEIFDQGDKLEISVIKKTAVTEDHFSKEAVSYNPSSSWGVPLRLITDVKRDEKNKKEILSYLVDSIGWVDKDVAFEMTCNHEIDNARPVFPKRGKPFLRTRRDEELFNNISVKG